METCTVTALDAITAFAVPNPNYSSQSMSVFSGLVAPTGCPVEQITQSTSDSPNFISASPFDRRRRATLQSCVLIVNAGVWCNLQIRRAFNLSAQVTEVPLLMKCENCFSFFSTIVPQPCKIDLAVSEPVKGLDLEKFLSHLVLSGQYRCRN
jgi:hypothetical protein